MRARRAPPPGPGRPAPGGVCCWPAPVPRRDETPDRHATARRRVLSHRPAAREMREMPPEVPRAPGGHGPRHGRRRGRGVRRAVPVARPREPDAAPGVRQEEARVSNLTPSAWERALGRPSERQPAREQHREPFRAPPRQLHGPFKGPSSYHRLCRWSVIELYRRQPPLTARRQRLQRRRVGPHRPRGRRSGGERGFE